ncbi:hypothetical protein HMPREF1987_01454 [Peptostreptococcaceae bacterium oral taxon 113 str. W5053]|nr:hypothetical protein HMPREF1987_01454 [Peptostreptococcaceae bacterium oral taxon 113 str. W5053]
MLIIFSCPFLPPSFLAQKKEVSAICFDFLLMIYLVVCYLDNPGFVTPQDI